MKKKFLFVRLMPYMENKIYLLYASLILSALSSILGLLPFIFLWLIIKELLGNDPTIDNVATHAWLTLASALIAMIFYFVALLCSHLTAFRVETGMRKMGMRKVINLPLGFFSENQTGKIRSIIDENASQTHTFLAHQLPDVSATVIAPIALLIIMLIIDWRMGLVSLIPIVLGLIAMSFMMNKDGEEFRRQYMDYLQEMTSESIEYVRGISVVKTFGQSVHAFTRFVDSITKYKEAVVAYTLMWKKPMAFYTVIMQSAAFFLVPFAIFSINANNLSTVLSNFIFYLLIAPNFTLLFMRSMYFQNTANMVKQSLDRFDAIMDYPDMIFEVQSKPLTSFDVEFKNVVFSYKDTTTNIVNGVSFTIKEGEVVALVGASGGGKTTIARLLARFWDVQSGEILIGGRNIKTLSRQALMTHITFVLQNTKLFNTSIRENIIYGKPDATDDEISRALTLSQSQEIIDMLPHGLDTNIGTSGTYLSGGQQQRIGLARALLKDAPIVILDEATAFADPENEHLIQQALKELSKGKTTLMIAHRLTTTRDADKILVIDKGNIVESGSHAELLSKDGCYRTMWDEYQQSIDWKLTNTERVL
ncbi:ABC transporter ATP-binding protein [Psychrobacter pygoscelis]|uniref:ABC transporter ATP-binding protein n=1 Tax=Psychrobacter pygoscelis TaxID=2488563 RepID=UPI00103C7013|nr:ABC transporter ATP-binding protein [Psychrobacter pygoscelis]